jgi:hypothetical protein
MASFLVIDADVFHGEVLVDDPLVVAPEPCSRPHGEVKSSAAERPPPHIKAKKQKVERRVGEIPLYLYR